MMIYLLTKIEYLTAFKKFFYLKIHCGLIYHDINDMFGKHTANTKMNECRNDLAKIFRLLQEAENPV